MRDFEEVCGWSGTTNGSQMCTCADSIYDVMSKKKCISVVVVVLLLSSMHSTVIPERIMILSIRVA